MAYSSNSDTDKPTIDKNEEIVQQLSALYVVGTYYNVGYAVGNRFKSEIEDFYNVGCLKDTLLPFYKTSFGRQIYDEYLHITRKIYPQYVEEMQGIADGSGKAFHEVFLIHIEPEITTILRNQGGKQPTISSGCTTLLLNYVDDDGNQQTFIAHNEDVIVGMKKSSLYLIHARIVGDDDNLTEEWSSLCYPGYLCGNTLTTNKYGMVSAVNRLFPDNVQRGKLPWYIQVRAFITAKSMEDLEVKVFGTSHQVALGMSFSAAFKTLCPTDQVVANIEIAPTDENASYGKENVNIRKIPVARCMSEGFYYHVNRYDRIPSVKEWAGEISSDHRRLRLQELPTPTCIEDLLHILGDVKDPEYPVYRSGKTPDYLLTAATGIFNLTGSTFSIYMCNPCSNNDGPVIRTPLSINGTC